MISIVDPNELAHVLRPTVYRPSDREVSLGGAAGGSGRADDLPDSASPVVGDVLRDVVACGEPQGRVSRAVRVEHLAREWVGEGLVPRA